MYSLAQLKRGLRSPNLFLREANRLYHRRLYLSEFNTAGVDIFEEDWDNLVILDACRYDMFQEQATLPGQLESRRSRGSNTAEFLRANFAHRELLDTVYVTANPQLYRRRHDLRSDLHATVEVWEGEGWDEEFGTVLPETMAEATLDAAARYPDKRLVSHFIQPHYPFLTGDVEFSHGDWFLDSSVASGWHQIMVGDLEVDSETIWTAYRNTLERALPSVERLLAELNGKTVVTADHGNMVGEHARPIPVREWGHPASVYTEQLVRVPWLVVDGERRAIEEGPRQTREGDSSTEAAEERLRDLGYVE